MDVYLVPVGPERYKLYCEIPDDEDGAIGPPPQGRWHRLVHRFREMIAEAERERRHGSPHAASRGWFGRMRARTMRWVAESIAEQRLLWHLRKQETACVHYPDDLPQEQAAAIVRGELKRDFDKHRFWLAIESVAFVASGLLMLVPGPNLIAYYLAFRLVGHFLSLRGASKGLVMPWRHEASAPLTELRRVLSLTRDAREPRVHAVAQTLRLEHLVSFFERTAVSA
jgi:predicted nucleic acid-binding protein